MEINFIEHKNNIILGLAIGGSILLIVGGFYLLNREVESDVVEIIPAETTAVETTKVEAELTADVEGAVIKPGVYKLAVGSRVENLLIAAGGLAGNADRDWADKNLNRAQKVIDGMKLYIPEKGELEKGQVTSASWENQGGTIVDTSVAQKININSATADQLDTLWGVGPATAKKIIDARPFSTVEELVSKKAISKSVLERIKNEISVF